MVARWIVGKYSAPPRPSGKRLSVMLSGAKHLQYLPENNQMQILRSAQDDSPGDFFRSLPVLHPSDTVFPQIS
jgi:hypothetical protein